MLLSQIQKSNTAIWQFYQANKRDFPWRQTTDPYKILVSEVMLQQTQTGRVVPYFEKFLVEFPTVAHLAEADTISVLKVWQGLGYNRRALFLQRAAQKIVANFDGQIPAHAEDLTTLPGIGSNTAGAILAYAFNQPAIFIETNIRKTMIHFFFNDQAVVSDREITEAIKKAIDKKRPRQWYWAVVDYGHWLGQTKTVVNSRSRHYRKQSQFIGSKRFVRSQILKLLLEKPRRKADLLSKFADSPHAAIALNELLTEKFCITQNDIIAVTADH